MIPLQKLCIKWSEMLLLCNELWIIQLLQELQLLQIAAHRNDRRLLQELPNIAQFVTHGVARISIILRSCRTCFNILVFSSNPKHQSRCWGVREGAQYPAMISKCHRFLSIVKWCWVPCPLSFLASISVQPGNWRNGHRHGSRAREQAAPKALEVKTEHRHLHTTAVVSCNLRTLVDVEWSRSLLC